MDVSPLIRNLLRLMDEQGYNPTSLAKAAGLHATAVRDILDQRSRNPRGSTLTALARTLGVAVEELTGARNTPAADVGDRPLPNTTIPTAPTPAGFTIVRDLPVRGRAQGGPDGVIVMGISDGAIDWTYRPPELTGVPDAFALFVDGDSMRTCGLAHGTTVFVHPHRRPRPGQFCVLITTGGEAFIKRYERTAAGKTVLSQTDPVKEFAFKEAEIAKLHLVVGAWFER